MIRYYYFSLTFIFTILTILLSVFYIFVLNLKNYLKDHKIPIISLIFSNIYLIIVCLAFYSPRFGYIPLFFINLFQFCILLNCVKKNL